MKNGIAMANTSQAIVTVSMNRRSNSLSFRVFPNRSSPRKRATTRPMPKIIPVQMNRTHAARITGRNAPATPMMAQAIVPAMGMARNRLPANSRRCSSSVRGGALDILFSLRTQSGHRIDKCRNRLVQIPRVEGGKEPSEDRNAEALGTNDAREPRAAWGHGVDPMVVLHGEPQERADPLPAFPRPEVGHSERRLDAVLQMDAAG